MFYASIFSNGSGAFRETGALRFLFIPKGALTHHPRCGWWYGLRPTRALRGGLRSPSPAQGPPSAVGLRHARLRASVRRVPANAAETAVPVIIVCAEGTLRHSLRLRKPATGSFVAEAGRIKKDRPAFSFAKEKQKWACGPERRNGEYRGNLP